MKEIINVILLVIAVVVLIVSGIFAASYAYRNYSVWSMEMQGKGNLAKATQDRQIQVEQAKSELDAAKHIADAIKIVGRAAQEFPEYRNQMYIQAFAEALAGGKIRQIIYVPTEAGIPILEASRLKDKQ